MEPKPTPKSETATPAAAPAPAGPAVALVPPEATRGPGRRKQGDKPRAETKTKPVTIMLEEKLANRLKVVATLQGMSLTAYVEAAVAPAIKRDLRKSMEALAE